ncbi:MAG TPA: metallophosphoesterase [Negativicutes bacterium]
MILKNWVILLNIFAIADLHLSGNPPKKPMDIFHECWKNHWERIKENWQEIVGFDDVVLIAGDTSWAMNVADALVDLRAIHGLPGRKIIIKGNHDFWWQSTAKMKRFMPDSLEFVHNSFVGIGADIAVCGSRGWNHPDDPSFSLSDERIYEREQQRILLSLNQAKNADYKQIILLTHFPLLYKNRAIQGIVKFLPDYNVIHCVYGHLHGVAIENGLIGNMNGTEYHLVSCDAIDFKIKKIMEI